MKKLDQYEMENVKSGQMTIAAVMAVLLSAVVAVVVYRLFMSDKGSTTIPGGFKFTWE